MKYIVIVGGGGFGWELVEYVHQDIQLGLLPDIVLKGVIDDETDSAKRSPIPLPYLGTISGYHPDPEDYLLLAIGNPRIKRLLYDRLSAVSSHFFSYVHSSVYKSSSAVIGKGVVVCPNCILNSGSILEDFSMLNVFCSIGHGAHVGGFSVLSPFSALNGDAQIGSGCFLGTRATVFPRVTLGNNCVVDSHSYVKGSVGDRKIITLRSKYMVLNNRLG